MKPIHALSLSSLIVLVAARANAQPATPAQMAGVTPSSKFATIHLKTQIGSFKVVDAQGRIEIDFKGTMLLSQVKGTVVASPTLRKEYDSHGRQVYFGKGKVIVTGSWRGIQWFGTELSAVWYGAGLIRLSGEFDKNLNTGEFWFSDPKKKQFWLTNGSMTVTLPSVLDVREVTPIERGKGTPPPTKKPGG